MSKKMSRRTAHRLALHYAIAERDSHAKSWGPDAPERKRAERQAAEFRRVLKEEFGEQTWEDDLVDSDLKSVSILDIAETAPTQQKDRS